MRSRYCPPHQGIKFSMRAENPSTSSGTPTTTMLNLVVDGAYKHLGRPQMTAPHESAHLCYTRSSGYYNQVLIATYQSKQN
jgi:hypothetical protein